MKELQDPFQDSRLLDSMLFESLAVDYPLPISALYLRIASTWSCGLFSACARQRGRR
jgi:hypothetical protein